MRLRVRARGGCGLGLGLRVRVSTLLWPSHLALHCASLRSYHLTGNSGLSLFAAHMWYVLPYSLPHFRTESQYGKGGDGQKGQVGVK